MINYKLICSLLVFSLLTVVVQSCSDEDEPAKSAAPGTMVATVDNQSWLSGSPHAVVTDNLTTITGEATDGSQLVLFISGKVTTGTYSISGTLGALPAYTISFTPANADVKTNPTYSSTYLEETGIG